MGKSIKKDPRYYDTDKPPLLMQGFDLQRTNTLTPIIEDRQVFTTRVNRGVVTYIDYQVASVQQISNGLNEAEFNSTQLTITSGGQELIVDEPAERYDYAIDLGDRDEHKVPVIINGGQQIISKFFLPNLTTSTALSVVMVGQLLAHYSTKRHDEWVKKHNHFGLGLGLKRKAFSLFADAGITAPVSTIDTIPKNQGKIIGFSLLFMGTDVSAMRVNLSFDDLTVIENVCAMRFSRLVQRDPFIIWTELNPGSTFKLELVPVPTNIILSNIWVIFYFDN